MFVLKRVATLKKIFLLELASTKTDNQIKIHRDGTMNDALQTCLGKMAATSFWSKICISNFQKILIRHYVIGCMYSYLKKNSWISLVPRLIKIKNQFWLKYSGIPQNQKMVLTLEWRGSGLFWPRDISVSILDHYLHGVIWCWRNRFKNKFWKDLAAFSYGWHEMMEIRVRSRLGLNIFPL